MLILQTLFFSNDVGCTLTKINEEKPTKLITSDPRNNFIISQRLIQTINVKTITTKENDDIVIYNFTCGK